MDSNERPPPLNLDTEVAPNAAESAAGSAAAAGSDAALSQFPCAQCGAGMTFAPGTTGLECPYCGHQNEIQIDDAPIEELDFHEHLTRLAEEADTEEQCVVKCGTCGAESTLAPDVTADECPFCGTEVVTTGESKRSIKPRSLLPFHVDRRGAETRWRTWLEGLWFAPGDLKKRVSNEKLQGVYVPFWTFDSEADSHYTGQRGDDYWTTETYTTMENGKSVTKTRQVKRTRWRYVSGRVHDSFDDVLVLASRSLPEKITRKLEPWDLHDLVPYSDDYLSGFRAHRYQVDLEQGFEGAKDIMDGTIRSTVCSHIGGDHQRISSLDSHFYDVTFKHVLLPIWISAYRYSEKVYRFVVNARTGEVQGERPWSWAKIALAVLGGLAILGGIGGLIAAFGS